MKKTIYVTLLFVVAMAIGFGVAFWEKKSAGSDPVRNDVALKDTTSAPAQDVPASDSVAVNPVEEIALSATSPLLNGNTYSFTVAVTGVQPSRQYHFELWANACVQKSQDGHFRNVPGIANGRYKVCVVDDTTNENLTEPLEIGGFKLIEKPQPKEGISAEEFQKRMLNAADHTLDGGRGSFVSRNMKIVVVDMKEGEQHPTDIQAIREKIDFGIWTSAQVVGTLSYDSDGLVTRVTIKPVY